jgi:hypothetical protein
VLLQDQTLEPVKEWPVRRVDAIDVRANFAIHAPTILAGPWVTLSGTFT